MSIPNNSTHFVLYLSEEGGSVKVTEAPHQDHCCRRSKYTNEAPSCKTQKQVLELLERIAEERENASLQFYHMNNIFYEKHSGTCSELGIHECSIDSQISFIKYKMMEQEHGVRHSSQNAWCVLL